MRPNDCPIPHLCFDPRAERTASRRWRQMLVALLLALFALALPSLARAKTVRYDLTVTRGTINLSGKKSVDFALMVNGSIPAPTLEFTEGDEAEITVRNGLDGDEEVSIHWHGLLLPPEEDGVAYVNTPPIFPGKSRTFRFPIRQHGTYWYHSHTMLQEQKGVFGAFVIHPKTAALRADREAVAILSDWTDEDPDQVLRNLRKDGDYYLHKKKNIRSYWGALRAGGLGTMLKNEWQRMGGMDLSDVGYDAFLINGKRDSQLVVAHPGERVRLRVINAAASSYFYLSLGNVPFQVVAADGVDVEPTWTREILLGMAETYDILFTVPEHRNYELRATVQDVTGYASAWVGMGPKAPAADKPVPDPYAPMDHGAHGGSHAGHAGHAAQPAPPATPASATHAGHDEHAGHGAHEEHGGHGAAPAPKADSVLDSLGVDQLRSPHPTAFPAGAPVHDLRLVLGGSMERYVWHINGKAIHQDRNLVVQEGEVVRFTFVNETMMHHPMHLHGHFFRVLNEAGERSPLKHTVDVPPHGTRVIEFRANEPGEWMLHCHNLYHMKTGMARVVKYSSYRPRPELAHLAHHDPHLHEHLYFDGQLDAFSNHGQAFLRAQRTWDSLELKGEARAEKKRWELEGDLFYRRWFGQYLNLVGGGTSFGEHQRAAVGVAGVLPLLFEAQALVDSRGDLRFDLHRRFRWTSHVLTEAELLWRQHEGTEWKVSLLYAPNWHWAGGLLLTDEKLGAGLQYRF